MWQSIPRTGSLLLRASRPHSVQRFPRCLLFPPSMPCSLRSAVSRCLLSSLHASPPALSGFPAASSPPSMLLSLRSAVYPLSLSPPDPVSPPLKHNKIS